MVLVDKTCITCGNLMESVHFLKLYCNNCRKIALKNNTKKHKIINPSKPKYSEEDYITNFYNCINEPYTYTIKGFNSVSKIKTMSYVKFFNISWSEFIKRLNKYNELYNYIINEYKIFIDKFKIQNVHKFTKYNNWITYDLLRDIGIEKIQEDCNCKKYRHTDQEYIDNFNRVKNIFGRIPLYNEFVEFSTLKIESYADKYNLKGKVYDLIIKIFATENEYNNYLQSKREHKRKIGQITGRREFTYTLKDIEENFKKIFNECYQKFNIYPSKRYFNTLSKIDDKYYRKRLNTSWLDICKYYGYNIDKNHKTEKIILQIIKKIIGFNYEPQKTWDWLIGAGGKHMYCDGYFTDISLVVEFDGIQHRKPVDSFGGEKAFKRLQENDKLKNKLIPEHGLILLRIDSREKWHDENYLRQKLISFGIIKDEIKNQKLLKDAV